MEAANQRIFDTVPEKDFLSFGMPGGSLNYKRVVDFLELKKQDVARATKVALSSVRYDENIPHELATRLEEIAIVCQLVAQYFSGDPEKTAIWFKVPNPLLGGLSPKDMIRAGRYKKLVRVINSAIQGEGP